MSQQKSLAMHTGSPRGACTISFIIPNKTHIWMRFPHIKIKNLCPVFATFFVTIVFKREILFSKHRRLCISNAPFGHAQLVSLYGIKGNFG